MRDTEWNLAQNARALASRHVPRPRLRVGGAYINRMSDHCGACRYNVKQKTGPGACPFNALYWDFLARHERRFRRNRRMTKMYASWDRMDPVIREAYHESAAAFLATLEPAEKGWAR